MNGRPADIHFNFLSNVGTNAGLFSLPNPREKMDVDTFEIGVDVLFRSRIK